MSKVDDSPVNSSSSDGVGFAAFLDAELDSFSDTSPEQQVEEEGKGDGDGDGEGEGEGEEEEQDDDDDGFQADVESTKRRKIQVSETVALVKDVSCTHPGVMEGLCIKCGEKVDDESGVRFEYIRKNFRLADDEVNRLRERDLKNLLRHKKLYLVLDLDHTLLNSTRFQDIKIPEEGYLMDQNDQMQGALKGSLFRLNSMHMLTKLRPFVHTFLKEASKLFEMYIYTMGERAYALEMANLLDPGGDYFVSRVIAQNDCTQRHQKGLDVVLGQESAVVILDDTEAVWAKHKENLILMERYHFFASSCKQFGYKCQSLSELKSDESDVDGALANVLRVLKQIHSMFFDPELGENYARRDIRQMLGMVRKEVLAGCKIVFTHVFPTHFSAETHPFWKMAERMGAICSREVDPSVTHVISRDVGTEKSRWAIQEKKFLVEPRWLEAANYFWQRQPEEKFPVKDTKSNQ